MIPLLRIESSARQPEAKLMTLTTTLHHPTFFAEIGGIDLKQPITADQFAEIEAAFNAHAILLFRDQFVSDDQQVAFGEWFGPVFTATKYSWKEEQKKRLGDKMADISNLDADGKLLPEDDPRRGHQRGNRLWHTDNTFKHVPSRCSLLAAHVIPAKGGNTQFADMRAAYDALPDAKKAEIDGLIAEHCITHSRDRMGFREFTNEARAELPPVNQVLVRTNEATGRKALYIASHAGRILGWPDDKGRALIDELIAHATQPQFVHEHEWREGDLIVWDNRATMHRATPFDEMTVVRDLRRVTVSDEINSVERAGLAAAE